MCPNARSRGLPDGVGSCPAATIRVLCALMTCAGSHALPRCDFEPKSGARRNRFMKGSTSALVPSRRLLGGGVTCWSTTVQGTTSIEPSIDPSIDPSIEHRVDDSTGWQGSLQHATTRRPTPSRGFEPWRCVASSPERLAGSLHWPPRHAIPRATQRPRRWCTRRPTSGMTRRVAT